MTIFKGGWPFANPPNVPFRLNRYSLQAKGLKFWVPVLGQKSINNLRDFSGNKIVAGTPAATPEIKTDGKRGQVLDLERGSSEYIDYGVQSALDVGSTKIACLSTWFNVESFPPENEFENIFSIGDITGGTFPISFFADLRWVSGVKRFQVGSYDSGSEGDAQWVYGSDLSTGVWYHLLGGYDGSDWKIFINGVEKASTTTAVGAKAYTGTEQTWIGGQYGGPRSWDGLLSDIRYYHVAPTASLAQHLYQNPWDLYQPMIPAALPIPLAAPIPPFDKLPDKIRIARTYQIPIHQLQL